MLGPTIKNIVIISYYPLCFVYRVFLCKHKQFDTLNEFPFGNSGFSDDLPLRLV
jgi:hypothetical protein